MEEGTLPARFFGTLDLFALWWMGLLAIGLAALTRRRVRRYVVVACGRSISGLRRSWPR